MWGRNAEGKTWGSQTRVRISFKNIFEVRTKEEKCFDMFSKNVLERLFRSVSFFGNEKDNFSLWYQSSQDLI